MISLTNNIKITIKKTDTGSIVTIVSPELYWNCARSILVFRSIARRQNINPNKIQKQSLNKKLIILLENKKEFEQIKSVNI